MSEETKPPGYHDFQCPHCDSWIRTPPDLSITTTACPGCGAKLTIPKPERQDLPARNGPGMLNGVMLGASVAVILGIYGYSMFRATTGQKDFVLTPPRPEPVETIILPPTPPLDPSDTVLPESSDDDDPASEPEPQSPVADAPSDEPTDQEIAAETTGGTPDEVTDPEVAVVDAEPIPEETAPATDEETPAPEVAVVDQEPPTEETAAVTDEDAPDSEIAVVDEEPPPEITMPEPDGDIPTPGVAIVVDETEVSPDITEPEEEEEEVAVFDEEEFLSTGWKDEASEALLGFMAATSLEARLTFVMDPERVRSSLRSIQQRDAAPWQDISPDDFKHVDLSEADRRKGIFLMMRDQAGDDPAGESNRSYAFFKRADDGLKLDFEVFWQTTEQTFQNFIESPQPGVSKVFRVFIAEDPTPRDASGTNYRSYVIADLANFNSATRIRVTMESPVGRILTGADFSSEDGARRIMRNATVELRWTDQPENSAIELSKFICWEFLGLGGEPVAD